MKLMKHLSETRISVLILSACIHFGLNAQTKTIELPCPRKFVIQNAQKCGDKGFVLEYGNYFNNKSAFHKISYFEKNLNKVWEYDVPTDARLFGKVLVSNESTDYVYYMSSENDKEESFSANTKSRVIDIYRFNGKGFKDHFTTSIQESSTESTVIEITADKDNLYYFSVSPVVFKSRSEIERPEYLYMHVLSHDKQSFSKKKLPIDMHDNGQLTLIGYDSVGFYICDKVIDRSGNQMVCYIYKVDRSGELLSKIVIKPEMAQFYSPATFTADWTINGDFSNLQHFYFNSGIVRVLNNALLDVSYDAKYDRFVMFGLSSPVNNQSDYMCKPVDGFILRTYDTDGKSQSKAFFDLRGNDANNMLLDKIVQGTARHINYSVISEDLFRIDVHGGSGKLSEYYVSRSKLLDSKGFNNYFKGLEEFNVNCDYASEMRMALITYPDQGIKSFSDHMGTMSEEDSKKLNSAMIFSDSAILFTVEKTKGNEKIVLKLFK